MNGVPDAIAITNLLYRYAELIDFDENSNTVYLHAASESEDEDEASPA